MKSLGRYVLTSIGWSLVTLVLIGLIVGLNIKNAELEFRDNANFVQDAIFAKLKVNEALIDGFAAFFRIMPENNYERARGYARDLRSKHPHIYKLEAQVQVAKDRREEFERTMQAAGFKDFRIKAFSYSTDRQWQDVAAKEFYFPIVFMEPVTKESRVVHGLDVDSAAPLQKALRQAMESNFPVASAPFELVQGGRAYVLFRGTGPETDLAQADITPMTPPQLVVSLVVLTKDLLPDVKSRVSGVKCSLHYNNEALGPEMLLTEHSSATPTSRLERLIFPRIEYNKQMQSPGQPFFLRMEKQLSWYVINWPLLIAFIVFSYLGLAVTLYNMRLRIKSHSACQQAYRLVEQEREHLDQRVQERTQELSEVNSRLLVEIDRRESVEDELRQRIAENRRLTSQMITLQESEHRSLAQELHDEMGQSLTAIKTDAVLIKKQTEACPIYDNHQQCPTEIQRSVDAIINVTSRLYDSVHALIRRFRPRVLDDLGLEAALGTCIDSMNFERIGIDCKQSFTGDLESLGEELSITLYRVLQEALTNIVKHAGARNVWIDVVRNSQIRGEKLQDTVCLSVRDDGQGMESHQMNAGYGLVGLRERVQAVGGTFEVSSMGNGVSIEVIIPIGEPSMVGR